MYILLDVCSHSGILRLIYFGLLILDIITTVVPICLILMLLIDFTKAVVSNDKDIQIKSPKTVTSRIICAIMVFLVPSIINIFVTVLSQLDINSATNYTDCLINAKSGNFEYYDTLLEQQDKLELEKQKNPINQNKNNENNQTLKKMADNLILKIEKEVGQTNGSKYSGSNVPWCAYFVNWAFKQIEVDGKNLFYDVIEKDQKVQSTGNAGCTVYNFSTSDNLKFHYSKHYGRIYNKDTSYVPKPGDTIYFKWASKGTWDGKIESCRGMVGKLSHIGLVYYVEGDTIHTIEGNASNKVRHKTYDINSKEIVGYGSWYDN